MALPVHVLVRAANSSTSAKPLLASCVTRKTLGNGVLSIFVRSVGRMAARLEPLSHCHGRSIHGMSWTHPGPPARRQVMQPLAHLSAISALVVEDALPSR